MIFKTFDSDIDNMSSHWGMFGKSFSDIGDTITTKWKQVTDYVAVTNDATISGMMSAWKGTSPVQFLSDDSVVNVLNDYNKALDKGAEATAKFFEAGTGNDFMNGWLKQLKGAPATMDDYKVAVAKAEVAQKGLTVSMVASKVAALALNVALSVGVSIAISALIKLVDNLVHANEKAIEKAEELRDKYNDFKETNASNVKTLNNLKDEFEELSDGVSQYGDNISLTTDQYARYQEIVQQIVGMSPSLAEGYDTENGYIADKNGLLERAIELQEIEYRNELRKITNLDNLKTSMSGYIAEYKEALNGGYVTSEGNIIGTTIDTDFKNSLWKVFNTNNRDNYDGQSMARDIMESLGVKDIDKEIEKYINEYGYWQDSDFWNDYCDKIVSNLDIVTNSLTAEEVGLDDTVFDQNIEKLESYAEQYSDMKDSVKSANESIQTDLGYIAEYADGYSDLSKEQQKFVTDYLKGFDISDITSENSMGILEYDEDKMAFVKSQIKKFVEELSHDDSTKQALTDLYAPPSDNETIEEYKKRIDSALEIIRKYCESNGIEIPVGISDVKDSASDLEGSYNQTITNAQEKFDDNTDWESWFAENVHTQEEIDKWREIAQACDTATEAKEKYLGSNTSTTKYTTDFTKLNTALVTLTDNAELLNSVNEEISKTSRISADNLSKINEAFPEDKYPEMTKALYEYEMGLISTEDVFAELENCYNQDKNAYIQTLTNKNLMDTEFLDTMKINYPNLFNELQTLYGEDLSGWKNMEQAKIDIAAETITQIAKLYQEFYKAMGVDNYVEFNAQVVKKATQNTKITDKNGNTKFFADSSTARVVASQGSLLNKNYSQDNFNNLVQNLDSSTEINGQNVKNSWNELQSKISGVLANAEKMKSALDGYGQDVFDTLSDRMSSLDWKTLGGGGSSSSDSSSSSEPTAEKLNWIERLINKISNSYSRLKNVVSDTTTTWLKRNNALSDSMSVLAEEISAQADAYDYYMNAFNSYDLDDYYKNQIANGSINIDVIYDDDLKDAISDCEDFYDKAQDAADSVQSLNIELKELAKSKFDNVASEFESKISQITTYSDQLQAELDIITAKGWFSSTTINEELKRVEQNNLDKLKQERNALMSALNSAMDSGKIEKYSEDWYDMQSSIDSVTSSILDAEKALIEYDTAIRQIKWDAFDRTRDDVEDLISETEFLVELLQDKGITDDDGNTTSEGKAAQALLVQKYQLYLNQAQKYKDEILKIDKELANNPYDKELLDRKQDLIDKQQEAIESSISEKEAIKDLVNDGYDTLLDALQKVIDKQKESLDSEKSLHDYQKTIAEQSATVAQLQKRLLALQGDDSESGQSQRQSISAELKDAKDELSESEYDQYIDDQTKMLDDLATKAEEWINARLDDLDGLIQQIIDDSNAHSGEIRDTITNTANDFGVNLSENMKNIWEANANNITNGINNGINGVTNVLANFGTKFDGSFTTLNNVVSGIESKVQEMLRISNEEAAQRQAELEAQKTQQGQEEVVNYTPSTSDTSNDYSYSEPDVSWDDGGDDSSSGGDGVDWIYSPDYYPKDQLNIDTSIVDRLKWHDYDSSFGARAGYYEQMGGGGSYTGSYDQNVWMLDWMKSHGYRKGTKSAIGGLTLTDEDGLGSEVIFSKKYGTLRQLDSGDMVFNADQVEQLWNLSKGITTPNMFMDNLSSNMPSITPSSSNSSVDIGGISVNVDKIVTDNPKDFAQQLTNEIAGNSKVQKILGEVASNNLLGKNSLSTRRYVR